MSGDGARLAAAAHRLVDSPFRLHGRDPATGLDCIGLVIVALQAVGRPVPATPRYTLRNTDIAALLALLPASGFHSTCEPTAPGDLLLLKPSPAQFHLGIASIDGALIHAHASLGRVVETPPPFPWPVLHRWRLSRFPEG